MEKISIIIPVYNVERYLDDCLASACSQTISELEIICIDDGSTDSSWILLEKWEKKDSRIKVFSNGKNMGLSYTRNQGLKFAQGKYIQFLDSDDKLLPNALDNLYKLAEQEKTDCIFFCAEPIYEDASSYQRTDRIEYKNLYPGIWRGQELFCRIIDNNEWIAPVQFQFLNRDFMERNGLHFFDGILHEDELFTFQTMLMAEKVLCLNDKYYGYRYRENSIISSPITKERIRGLITVYLEMQRFCEKHILDEGVLKQINRRLERMAASIRKSANLIADFDLDEICNKKNVMEYQLLNFVINGERLLKNVSEISKDQLRYIRTFQNIILYGAGKIGREVLQILDVNDIGVLGYAVSDTKRNQKFVMGHPVHEIEEWGMHKESALIIITISKYSADELKANLLDKGFKNVIVLEQYM